VEDGVLLLSTPVKTLTPSPTARLLGTVNRQLIGLVAKSTGKLVTSTKNLGDLSAKPAGLLFGEIEQITQFSEAAVLIWSELHLRAGQSAIIPAQRTPVEDGVLLLSTPVKTLTPSPTARLLGTVNRQLIGLVAKSTSKLVTSDTPTKSLVNLNAEPVRLLLLGIEQITQFLEVEVLTWSGLQLCVRHGAIIPTRRTPMEDDVLPLSTPVKTPTISPIARSLGIVNRQLVGLVAKSTGELPCQPSSFKNSRILNAEPVTLLLREIEKITQFSEAVVLIWLELHLHAKQDVITPIRRTPMEDGVLPLSTPVKTLTPSPTARLLGTVNPQLIGLVAKYTGEVLIEDLLRGDF